MKRVLIAIFLTLAYVANGQETEKTFSGSYNNTLIETVILDIENELGFQFYFKKEWLETLEFTGNFSNSNIESVLEKLFEATPIRYYHNGKQVFLTNGIEIITSPELISAIQQEGAEEPAEKSVEASKELLFTREYKGETENKNDLESFVFEIGSRAQFQAGTSATLIGYVTDNSTNEPVEGAMVYTTSGNKAAITGPDGFYSLSITSGRHEIQTQFTGMKRARRNIVLFSNGQLDIGLDVDVIALNEVVVEANRRANVEQVNTGIERINMEESSTVPAVLGEKDILKVATTFAGIQTVGEGAAGFNVRGGKSDQNLFLFEGATVYNASHFLGFFSVFNSDALEGMEVMKSGIPASYGGRLSSVFDITAKTPNKEKLTVEGGVSSVTSRLTAEVPVIKEKASLMASGRITYSDWMLQMVDHSDFSNNKVNFNDFIVKYDHQIDQENRVTLAGYLSNDRFRLNSDTLFSFSDFSYVNQMGTAKWSHRFNATFDASMLVSYSKYGYDFESTQLERSAFGQDYDISEHGVKLNFNKDLQTAHQLNFGAEIKRYNINPGSKFPIGSGSEATPLNLATEQGLEGAAFIADNYEINEKLSLNYGLRYSFFSYLGPGITNIYLDGAPMNPDTKIGEETYGNGEFMKTYHGPEIRLAARYLLDPNSSVKFSFDRSRQYLHALSNSASLSPTDLWRLSNEYIEPQIGDQISVGYYHDLQGGDIKTSVEVYGKRLNNLVDFKIGADFLLNDRIETIALQGPGKSYGIEFSLKKEGRLNGWFNYSYARTFIKLNGDFEEETINNGEFFPTTYDKPHTINLVSNYEITRRFSFSYNLVYNTGRPITYPTGLYELNGIEILNYSDRNEYRIPDYLRMDIGFTLKWGHRLTKDAHSFWSFSIYNLLGRRNPYSVYFDLENGDVQGYKLSVFGTAIPTISYNFKF